MLVIVQLDREMARAVRQGDGASRTLLDAARALGCVLTPVHPDINDAPLGTYFSARPPAADAERVADALRKLQGVTAAYAKPGDAPA